jgi:hypothetical protein
MRLPALNSHCRGSLAIVMGNHLPQVLPNQLPMAVLVDYNDKDFGSFRVQYTNCIANGEILHDW